MIKLNVKFIRRLYGTEDGEFSIFAVEPVSANDFEKVKINDYGNFTVSGEFSLDDSEMGTSYTVDIQEDHKSKYPNSYKLIKLHYTLPTSAKDQWEYLIEGRFVHIEEYFKLRNALGKQTKILDLILEDPEKVCEKANINNLLVLEYRSKLLDSKNKAILFNEYGGIDGIGPSTIQKLVNISNDAEKTIIEIEENPFSIMRLDGIGFLIADKIRAYYGQPLDSKERILYGTSFYLNEGFQSTGDTYIEIIKASKDVSYKINVSYSKIIQTLAEANKNDKEMKEFGLKIFGQKITTRSLYEAELLVFKRLHEFKKRKHKLTTSENWAKIKEEVVSGFKEDLSKEQSEFLDTINTNQVVALLGPGGSGKSWVTKIACEMIAKANRNYGLFAPTARAAHVMSEYVGAKAQTIHRGLMRFSQAQETAPYDVIIIDEASMVDSELAKVIIEVMSASTRLIIIGDDFQLQSVGPGNILFDIVNNIKIKTIHLTTIFRQDKGSGVLDYAYALRKGQFSLPQSAPKIENKDIVFINESNGSDQNEIALNIYRKSLKKYRAEDLMLLSPVNQGPSGRRTLNKEIQSIVNPNATKNDIIFGARSKDESKKRYFRKNDYITVRKNNYEMVDKKGAITEIINGDLGYVEDTTKKKLVFSVDSHEYIIDKSEINELIDHAWSVTIHKSQGGQADDVIIVIPQNAQFMLSANMLYTAITRTKKKCYVIGDFAGINKAAKRQANLSRRTMIQYQTIRNKQKK